MIGSEQLQQMQDATVVDSTGDKIGSAGQVYLDDSSGQPEWITVKTGLFGTSESFVPLAQASFDGTNVSVPFDKDKVKNAPRMEADEHLDPDQERELYRYYNLDYDAPSSTGTRGTGTRGTGTSGTGTSGTGGSADTTTTGRNTDEAMTRSEERLNVGTEQRETGRARLRKYVVTELETVTVPVTREKARLEREPITDENRDEAMSGPAFSDEEHEVTLREERPTVSKEEVPVERVRLTKDTATGEEQVSEDIRKERIEAEGDVDRPGGDTTDRR